MGFSLQPHHRRAASALLLGAAALSLAACRRDRFPAYPSNYREFAYITDGQANAVTVLDLVYLRKDRSVNVGRNPSGIVASPTRNEIYAVNTGSDSVSVIDAGTNTVAATIGVHHTPYFLAVSPDGLRAYVPNSGSNTVSVLDLDKRREIATVASGEGPGVARVSPDNRALVVSNRTAGSVSIYNIGSDTQAPLRFRSTFSGCPGATDIAILPDSSKAFIACSGGHQVMVVWLAAAPESYRGQQDATLQQDHLLSLLDVGKTPVQLAMEPSGNEVFSMNFDSDSISEISTWTNEVIATTLVGPKPVRGVISEDTGLAAPGTLWVSTFGTDSIAAYSIDDSRVETSVRTGAHPDAIAFSTDQHALLVVDTGSADVAVIRTQKTTTPELVTMLPAGAQPHDIAIKSFHVKRNGAPKTE
ncbi:YncE family protein [Bryocella elongata]|uniref:YncE family protein n=1 Tax=Bryocella elongata TaxID=863522 RepID=UPI001F27CE61|nr:YncE family protein [Bryocella elongata]